MTKRVARKKKWLRHRLEVTLLNWKLFEGAVAPQIPKHNSPSKFLSLGQYTTKNACSIVTVLPKIIKNNEGQPK